MQSNLKRQLQSLSIAVLICLITTVAVAQTRYDSSYWGAVEYRTPLRQPTLPRHKGQTPNATNAYRKLDILMRMQDSLMIDRYIRGLEMGDTLAMLARTLYRLIDDDPIAFSQWDAEISNHLGNDVSRWHYHTSPSHLRSCLERRIRTMLGDSLVRTGYLLQTDIIAHIRIVDTTVIERGSSDEAPIAPIELVTVAIVEGIKGRRVPAIDGRVTARAIPPMGGSNWARIQGLVDAPAKPGTVFQFQSLAGLRPGDEFIAFINCSTVRIDQKNIYFTLEPFWGLFDIGGGMYRIEDGKVVDANDDFRLGGKNLTPEEWKKRLRERIARTIHP